MTNHLTRQTGQKTPRRKDTRALKAASLTRTEAEIVISKIDEALESAQLPTGSDTGIARLAYLKSYVWTKYSDHRPGVTEYSSPSVRKALAIEKWQETERRNASTNVRLRSGVIANFRTCKRLGVYTRKFTSEDIASYAKTFIKSVLGMRPPHNTLLQGMFTNGASTRVKRSPCSGAEKFEGRPHATAQASLLWSGEAFANPGWGHLNPEGFNVAEVKGSVMFTVPKNSRIDRVACKEPEVNAYLQRSVGLFISKRLKKSGIDLNDQTRNQHLSRIAYSRGLATIDLSAASDSISSELVKKLVPPEWYELLNAMRSQYVLTPDSDAIWHRMEMFSSMGNGFTFELESLIFWALTRACSRLMGVKGTISVFGDDIICPLPVGRFLSRAFAFFGFTVNTQKSCTSGGYRESCGAHWYYGTNVKPFFVRRRPRDVRDLIQIANQLMDWLSWDQYDPNDRPTSLVALWGYLATLIDTDLYGGQSFERTDALVTGHAPRKTLRRKMKRIDVPQLGAYLSWHHSKLVTATVTSPSEVYREIDWVLRPNRSWYDRDVTWRTECVVIDGLGRF